MLEESGHNFSDDCLFWKEVGTYYSWDALYGTITPSPFFKNPIKASFKYKKELQKKTHFYFALSSHDHHQNFRDFFFTIISFYLRFSAVVPSDILNSYSVYILSCSRSIQKVGKPANTEFLSKGYAPFLIVYNA